MERNLKPGLDPSLGGRVGAWARFDDLFRSWVRPGSVSSIESLLISLGAILASLVAFGIFMLLTGRNPFDVLYTIYKGGFGNWFAWQNTLLRAAPLLLTALCTAIPARLGLMIIGGEGALILGALATVVAAVSLAGAPPMLAIPLMALAAACVGGAWVALAGWLREARGVNETISSLLLNYIAIALMNHLISGVMRDPAVVHRPSSWSVGDAFMVGQIPGITVHWGLAAGVILCLCLYVLMTRTSFGFAAQMIGGNVRAARLAGLSVTKYVLIACCIGGAGAGLAGMFEVAAGEGRVSSSIVVGYGYTGILVAFIARQNPLAIIPVAILLGGIRASGGLLQRWHDLPDASVLVLQGLMFVMILSGESLHGRLSKLFARRAS
ncbi:MAG: ABC transporter permease [Parvibaculaceae bacterium]